MKSHRRITRAVRALAVSGCLFAIALPASAGARPIDYHPVSQEVAAIAAAQSYHNHGRPAGFAPSSGARYEGSVLVGGQSTTAYTPPAGFHTDAQTNGKPTNSTPTSSVVVREVHTVSNGSDHTLAIVLASCALGIALCGTAFAVVRTSRLQRRVASSNS